MFIYLWIDTFVIKEILVFVVGKKLKQHYSEAITVKKTVGEKIFRQ